jgi:hypothetical protein
MPRLFSTIFAVLLCSFALAAEQPVATALGETIYVPIYSSIFFHDSKRTIDLAATLSIHNVDPAHPLTITKVDYYDTQGKMIRGYLEKPAVLAPFETRNFVIEKSDTTGGTGANFIVEWRTEQPVITPLVEALMVSLSSNQSISFTSQAKVIKRLGPTKD